VAAPEAQPVRPVERAAAAKQLELSFHMPQCQRLGRNMQLKPFADTHSFFGLLKSAAAVIGGLVLAD
jgi:hypothetical protein